MTTHRQQGVPWVSTAPFAARQAAPASLACPDVRGIVCLLAMAVLVTGCECAPARPKPWRYAPDIEAMVERQPSSEMVARETARIEVRQRRSHTLRVHMDRKPRHLNPMVSPSVWTLRIAQDTIFETLIRYEPPEGGAGTGPGLYRSGLARSWRVSPNGREIRIELEPDVMFHDGRKMSSVDVQFSLDAARSPRVDAEHLRPHLADVAAVELIGPRALRIRLARPNGYVLRALAQVPILPAHVYENQLAAKRGPMVGTGPYRLESWDEDVIRLAAAGGYWGEAPRIPTIEFVYEPDAARALTAAKRGELDFVPALIRAHYPEQTSAPGIVSSFAPIRLRPPGFEYLLMDAGEPPLDDVRVRRALASLIDRKAVAKDAYGGLARPVAGPIWPGGPGDGAAPAPPGYDPAMAAQLLDEAGWRDRDKDGVRERDGKSLRLSLLVLETSSKRHDEVRDLVLRAFRRTGIVVEQRAGSEAVLRNRLTAGDFDLALMEWRGSVDQDLAPLLETAGDRNFGRFSGHALDEVFGLLRGAWEPSARAPLMGNLARAIAESWPMAPIIAPDPYGLMHRRVRGVVVWNGWISLRSLWLEEE